MFNANPMPNRIGTVAGITEILAPCFNIFHAKVPKSGINSPSFVGAAKDL